MERVAEYQLAKNLDHEQIKSIMTFLAALTGQLPRAYIKAPKLP